MNIQFFVRQGNRAALPLLYAILDAPEPLLVTADAYNEPICFERADGSFNRFITDANFFGDFFGGDVVFLYNEIKNLSLLVR